MDVLVTGGTGFIGSHIAKALKENGHRVRLLVRNPQKAEQVLNTLGFTVDAILPGDVTDDASVRAAVQGCDAVIHSAAMVATAERYADQVEKTNVGGTKRVIGAALDAGVKKIIHVSSVTALFNPDDRVMHEDTEPGPGNSSSPYGRSKVACENYVRGLQAQGKPIIITYPGAVIGPNDPGFTEPHLGLQLFVSKVAVLTSSGIQHVDVRDVAAAHVLILEKAEAPNRFVMGGEYFSWGKLTRTLEKLTGRHLMRLPLHPYTLGLLGKAADAYINYTGKELPITSEGVGYATQWVYADNRKLEKELGFHFRDGEETLKDTLRWMYQAGHLSAKQVGRLSRP